MGRPRKNQKGGAKPQPKKAAPGGYVVASPKKEPAAKAVARNADTKGSRGTRPKYEVTTGQRPGSLKGRLATDTVKELAERNPDLSESWKTRELDVIAPNRIVRDLTGTVWDPMDYSTNNLWAHTLSAIIAKIDACFPGFFTSTTTSSSTTFEKITPADLNAYLQYVIMCYFNAIGVATGAADLYTLSSDIQDSDLAVPPQLAYLLQYFAPYVKGGRDYSCVTTSNAARAASGGGFVGPGGASNSINYGLIPTYGRGALVPLTTGEWAGAVGSSIISGSNIRGAAQGISNLLRNLCNCVPLNKIPRVAPDASAYAIVVLDASNDGNRIISAIDNFDSEVTYFIGRTVSSSALVASYSIPLPGTEFPEGASINASLPNNPTTLQQRRNWFALSWAEVLYHAPYIAGATVKTALSQHDYGKVTSIIVIPRLVDLSVWHAYIGMVVTQSITGVTASSVPLHDDMVAALAYLDSVLVAKLGEFNMWGRTANGYFGYDRAFEKASVPLHAKHFLESIGPVIRSGRIQIPQLMYTGGDFMLSQQSVALRSNTVLNYPYQGQVNESAGTAWAAQPTGVLPNVAGGFNAGILYPITPMVFSSYIAERYEYLMTRWGTVGTVYPAVNAVTGSLPLYPLDAITILGDVVNHTFAVVANSTQITEPYAAGSMLAAKDVTISAVGAHASLSRIDLSRVFMTAYYTSLSADPATFWATTYVVRCNSVIRPAASMIMGDTSTLAKEAATNSLTGKKGGIRSINGKTVDTTQSNPLMSALAPIVAMTGASLIPPAIDFVKDVAGKFLGTKMPSMQYSAFGSAPPKLRDEEQDKVRGNQVQHIFKATKGYLTRDPVQGRDTSALGLISRGAVLANQLRF